MKKVTSPDRWIIERGPGELRLTDLDTGKSVRLDEPVFLDDVMRIALRPQESRDRPPGARTGP